MQKDVTISARIPKSLAQQIEKLSKYNKRSKSWLVEDAMRHYVLNELDLIEKVEQARRDIRAGRMVSHEEVKRQWAKYKKKLMQ
jgi:predicted transcriptional regulator